MESSLYDHDRRTFQKLVHHRDTRTEISPTPMSSSTWSNFWPEFFWMSTFCTFSLLSTRQLQEGRGAISFTKLHSPALGALSLRPPCMRVTQSRRTLLHAISHRKTEKHLFSFESITHDFGPHKFHTTVSLFRTVPSERIFYCREPHSLTCSVMVVPRDPSQSNRCLGQPIAQKRLFVRPALSTVWRNDNKQ